MSVVPMVMVLLSAAGAASSFTPQAASAATAAKEALTAVINHPALRTLPFYLETPNELPGYAAEIKLLRERFKE